MPQKGWKRARVLTIGHSNRSLEDFLALLETHGVRCVVDVRSLPGSRKWPWFNKEALEVSLAERGLDYRHLSRLGGRRRGPRDPRNDAWQNASFRAYADYMDTEAFSEGLEELRVLAAHRGKVALLCAEALPWRCHRSLISDALHARGVEVEHILSSARPRPHRPVGFARFEGLRVHYPAEALGSGL